MEENYKILLVDDEEEVRTSIIRKIDWEKTGFTVIGDAENGRDALEKIELLEPDVVLTDIRMPYMDGLELAAELHRSRPSIRLGIFSGYDDFEYAEQAIRLDITEYILKPVNARELTEILEKLRASLDEEIERLRGETALRESFAKNLDVLRENFLGNLVKGKAESAQIARSMEEYGLGLMRGNCWTALKINIGGGGSIFSMTKEQSMAAVPVRRLLDSRLSEWGEFTSFHRPSGLSVIAALEDEAALAGLMTLLDDVCRESRKILRQPLTVGIGRIVSRIEEIEQSYSSAREAVSYGGIAGDVIYINDVEPQQRAMLWLDDKAGAELNHALCFGDEESILSCVENIVRPMKGGAMANGVQAYLIGILNVILRVVQKYGLDEQLIFGEYGDYNGVLSGITEAEETARWLSGVCFSVSGCVSSARRGTTRTIIQEAKRYIEENYQNSMLSLEMLCGHLHMSTAYFSTIFKREVGESYTSYLTGIRMEKAAELLKSTDDKTYAIAARVGYDEPNYFSYVFKKRFGVSPNKFRGK